MSELDQKWHALNIEEAVQTLNTDLQAGLSTAEAQKRLDTYGYNELQEKPPTTFWERLLDQLKGFVVIILLVAAVISAAMGDWVEAVVIMAIVVLNAAIGVIQESKAEEALEALKKMAAPDAQVLRDGHRVTIPARELIPGDVVILEAGSIVPADLRFVESANLKIEEASLTGESVPVNKYANKVLPEDAGLGDRRNLGFMSTTVTYGRATGVVIATGMQTEMGHIAEMIQSVEDEQTPLQRKLDDVGKSLGIGSLIICGLVFVVSVARPLLVGDALTLDDVADFFMIAISLAIAAVPEGLPAVVTICLALGMQEMVKRHALIRRLPAVETLGSATVICSDKTGTLTQNQMTVTRVWVADGEYAVTGKGYNPEGTFTLDGQDVEVTQHKILENVLWGSTLCNDALLEKENGGDGYRMIGDPTEGSMVVAAAKAGMWRNKLEESFPRVAEIPFDSERKRMTTIHDLHIDGGHNPAPISGDHQGYIAIVKGAPDLVLDRCTHIATAEGVVEMSAVHQQTISEANAEMASQALRVLAVAYRPLSEVPPEPKPEDVEQDLVFMGLMGMIDPARPEIVPAVKKALGAGLRTVMVTGDYAITAAAIAREIGILRPNHQVISGKELEEMDDEQLNKVIDNVDVFARVAPHHKVRIVEALRSRNNVVAMTGDGVNDAPALKRADIGVAMGITGTDVSKQTADMVLTDDNYVSIVSAIEQGRVIYSNIRKFVYFLLSCNMAEIAILFIAALLGWPVPLTAIQLLWLNLLSDGAPALALGLEKGDPDIMERPPRPPDEPVINREMISGVVVQTIAITAAVLLAYSRGTAFALATGTDPIATAETLAFVTLVLSELFRAYTSRSERYPLFKLGLFSNKWMQYAVGFSVLLLMMVVYVPFFQPIFNTIPLTFNEWLLVLPLTLVPSVAAEIYKAVTRRMAQ
ncbi:MAG: calcium-translocating P-type ATPase, SERCA-type [Anaerolineae bacterium]|nr:calcium-translocating P-type ATPase, SERCA-type [Anaerolineae bacterium]